MTQQEVIKSATLKARKDFEAYIYTRSNLLFQYYEDVANELDKLIYKYHQRGLKGTYLTGIRSSLQNTFSNLRTQINLHIKTGISNAYDFGMMTQMKALEDVIGSQYKLGIGTSFIDQAGKVHRYDATKELLQNSMWFRMNQQAINQLLAFSPDGLMFSERIWKNLYMTQTQIRSTIVRGLIAGDSPATISRKIRGFLHEPNKLFRRVRDKNGNLQLSKAASEYNPGAGVYRSSYMNSMRLARTEYARAYTEGTIRYAETKKWIKGYYWRTGGTNPCPDCTDLDGDYFEKGSEIMLPLHPSCMCWLELVIDEKG